MRLNHEDRVRRLTKKVNKMMDTLVKLKKEEAKPKVPQLTREIIKKLKERLGADGQAHIMVTRKGRLFFLGKKQVKLLFSLNRPEVQEKALQTRMQNHQPDLL